MKMRRLESSLSGARMKTTSRSSVDGARGTSLRRYGSEFSTRLEYNLGEAGGQQQWPASRKQEAGSSYRVSFSADRDCLLATASWLLTTGNYAWSSLPGLNRMV